jgi:hypothetical protein
MPLAIRSLEFLEQRERYTKEYNMKEIIAKSFLVIVALFLFGGFITSITGCMSLEEKLASSDYETRKAGEAELWQNAVRSGNESELRSAISRMTCRENLWAVVLIVDSVDLAKLALSKIEDTFLLAFLADNVNNVEIRGLVVERIADKDPTYFWTRYEKLPNAEKEKLLGRMAPAVIASLPYNRCLVKRWNCVSRATVLAQIIENDLQEIPEKDWQPLITKAMENSDEKVHGEIEAALALQYASHYDSMSKEARGVLLANLQEPTLLEKMIMKPKENAEKGDKPKSIYVQSSHGRVAICEKLGDDVLVKHANEAMKDLPKFHDYEKFDAWDDLNLTVANIKDVSLRQGYWRKMLEIIGKEEAESDGETEWFLGIDITHYKWTEHDTAMVKRGVSTWKLGEHLDVVRKMLQENVIGWQYVIDYATSRMLVELLKDGVFKNVQLRMAAAQQISSSDIDLNLYQGIANDDIADDEVKKILMSRMPESLKAEALKINEAEINELLRVAEEKSQNTFSLHGFYLGMPLRDAKRLLDHSFPDANIKVDDRYIDVDVSDSHGMHFCEADAKGMIYRLSFNPKMLKKWYLFDVQDYEEWAEQYSKKSDFKLASRPVKGEKEVEDSWIRVYQEAYSRVNNFKGYRVTYFGKKDVTSCLGNEEIDFSVMRDEASAYKEGLRVGKINGLKKWPRRGWENGDGAREGTLRAEVLKED